MTPGTWRSTLNDPPDWKDGGAAELRHDDGQVVVGKIELEAFFAGEDEIPVPKFFDTAGNERSFFDASEWRRAV